MFDILYTKENTYSMRICRTITCDIGKPVVSGASYRSTNPPAISRSDAESGKVHILQPESGKAEPLRSLEVPKPKWVFPFRNWRKSHHKLGLGLGFNPFMYFLYIIKP